MKVRFAILAAAAGVALTASAQAAAVWTAYNDCQSSTNGNPANTTLYGYNGTPTSTAPLTGQLKDFDTGNSVAATVTVVGHNLDNTAGAAATGEFATGTPAANIFGGKAINTGSGITYGTDGWYVDLTFTNLTPGRTYTLATTVDRGSNYNNRWSVITLNGAVSSTYASGADQAGVLKKVSDTVVSLQSYQTLAGRVAEWTDIDAGADNSFSVHFTYPTDATQYGTPVQDAAGPLKAYGPAMFMLQETTAVPEPATLSLLALGGVAMLRRRK